MPLLLFYFLKLSISLAVVWLFYQLVLRKLTFYNWNRFYLIAYTALAFVMPFININQAFQQNNEAVANVIRYIPAVEKVRVPREEVVVQKDTVSQLSATNMVLILIMTGVVIMVIRLFIQLWSFRKMLSSSRMISNDGVKLYQVDRSIIPFSFGKSIFINQHQHTETELREILRHEFVHIRQKHTIDILWSELLCIINWYNPAAWLIRKSVRQNLEFIADDKVIQSGIEKKHYQYLLLKVVGNNEFSIASQFNFSSLKKRIAMMNKMKSAKVHLLKFLFLLPLFSVLILSFRTISQKKDTAQAVKAIGAATQTVNAGKSAISVTDTLPAERYLISLYKNNGSTIVTIKDKNQQEIKKLSLAEWNSNKSYYENLYGKLPKPVEAVAPIDAKPAELAKDYGQNFFSNDKKPLVFLDGVQTAMGVDLDELISPDDIESITVLKGASAIAAYGESAKDGVLKIVSKKYASEHNDITFTGVEASAINQAEDANYTSNIGTTVSVATVPSKSVKSTESIGMQVKPAQAVNMATTITASPATPAEVVVVGKPSANYKKVETVTVAGYRSTAVEKEILAEIKSDMTEEEIKKIEKDLKGKGFDFSFTSINYKSGKLAAIKGILTKKKTKQHFSASGFSRIVIRDEGASKGEGVFGFAVDAGSLSVNSSNDD